MARLITEGLINRITGGAAETWLEPVSQACGAWEIDTADRVAMFLAQTAHESAGFRRLVENLKYSAAGLMRTWPTRYDQALAERLAYDEYAIAEHSYGGRYGNRPEGVGDGWSFRGRGLIQVTFRNNYLTIGEHIGADEDGLSDPWLFIREPDRLVEPIWAAYAATCFWDINGCSDAADAGDFAKVTRIVSGSVSTLDEREHWLDIVRGEMR